MAFAAAADLDLLLLVVPFEEIWGRVVDKICHRLVA
jgi:hypothetical protein